MTSQSEDYAVFLGHSLIKKGSIEEVVTAAKSAIDSEVSERIAIFEDSTGRVIDIDYRGTVDDVLDRLKDHPLLSDKSEPEVPKRKGPGRPKLGVISKEISLLPRHWQWLGEQKGGASATIRRLVEEAQKLNPERTLATRAQEAAHRFMWDIAGDFKGFEEASRAFYKADFRAFYECISTWPNDVREHARRFVETYRDLDAQAQKAEQERASLSSNPPKKFK